MSRHRYYLCIIVLLLAIAFLGPVFVRDARAVQPQIAGDGYHTVGLRSDGTVVAVGDNNNGQCNVSGWQLHIPGDINADGSIDLVDAFLALQLMAGFEPASSAYKGADVNDDGKIGIEEAVYIIQHVAVLR